MKNKLWVVALFLLLGSVAFGQDFITLKSGDIVKAKVLEIDGDAIRYKIYGYEDGPIITIYAPKVLSITYANGYVQRFNVPEIKPVPEKNVEPTATSQTTQTTPQPAQPTPQTVQPTPQTTQPMPQTVQPTPQKAEPTLTEFYKITERQRLLSKARTWSTIGTVFTCLNIAGGVCVAIVTEDWLLGLLSLLPGMIPETICMIVSNNYEKQAKTLAYTPLLQHEFQFESCSLNASIGTISSLGLCSSQNTSLMQNSIGTGISLRF